MKSNDKRKSYLIIFLTFVFCSICKELGEFIIKGETQIHVLLFCCYRSWYWLFYFNDLQQEKLTAKRFLQ